MTDRPEKGNLNEDDVIGAMPVAVGVSSPHDISNHEASTDQSNSKETSTGARGDEAFGVPNTLIVPGDPEFSQQWHLLNSSNPQTDLNVTSVWDDYQGNGVVVGVIDEGVDPNHSSLAANLRSDLDWDAVNNDSQPNLSAAERHGTSVAGMIAGNIDGIGSVGVAPGAGIADLKVSFGAGSSFAAFERAFERASLHNLDIINNSWGYNGFFFDNFATSAFQRSGQLLTDYATNGRGGLGGVTVFAAGNGGLVGQNTNYHSFQNDRHLIAVGATDRFGNIASFSTPGASILVSAPGVETYTTDRVGSLGFASGDFASVSGTSFASPAVAGVVALLLEANPNLGARDVQDILAYSARNDGVNGGGFVTNGAGNWNGGGLTFSHNFGFGLADAHAAVRLAETWRQTSTFNNESSVSVTNTSNLTILNSGTVSRTLNLSSGIDIDTVTLDTDITHSYIGDLTITLTSPSGTVSTLVDRPGKGSGSTWGTGQDNIDFLLTSEAFRGEDSGGLWTVQISDAHSLDGGFLDSVTLAAYGDAGSQDDTYVFTDQYSSLASGSRSSTTDTGGNDILNLAAVTSAVTVDLAAGNFSFSGASHTLNGDFETVFGGDAGDILVGDATADELVGMRGADTLTGGAGADTLSGGRGDDVLSGGTGEDIAVYSGAFTDYSITLDNGAFVIADQTANRDGTDRLSGVEKAQFSDGLRDLATQPTLVLNTSSVAENLAAGTLVGTASVLSGGFETYAFSFTGAHTGDFTIDATTGQIRTVRALNHEEAATHTLVVRAAGSDATILEETVSIAVDDVNEVATGLSLSSTSIVENVAIGTSVGTVSVDGDPDVGDTHSYSLVDNAGGRFSINSSTGEITTAAVLDYESASSHGISIRATDSGGLSVDRTVFVSVADVNDAPDVEALSITLLGDAVFATGKISASDQEEDSLSYSISTQPDSGTVSIDQEGNFLYTAAVSAGTGQVDSFDVQVSDENGDVSLQNINVQRADVSSGTGQLEPVSHPSSVVGVQNGFGNIAVSPNSNSIVTAFFSNYTPASSPGVDRGAKGDLVVQKLNLDGTAASPVHVEGNQVFMEDYSQPSVVGLADGGFAVAWYGGWSQIPYQSSSGGGIEYRQFDAAGKIVRSHSVPGFQNTSYRYLQLNQGHNGEVLVAYAESTFSNVVLGEIQKDGSLAKYTTGVGQFSFGSTRGFDFDVTENGYVIAGKGPGSSQKVNIYDKSLGLISSSTVASPGELGIWAVDAAEAPDGTTVVAFVTRHGSNHAYQQEIFVRRVAQDGTEIGNPVSVAAGLSGINWPSEVDLVVDPSGNVHLAWNTGTQSIKRSFDSALSPLGDAHIVATGSAGDYHSRTNDLEFDRNGDLYIFETNEESPATIERKSYSQLSNGSYIGTNANELIVASSSDSNVSAGGGNDQLQGSEAADTLKGDAGNDIIKGNGGADTLTGGSGDDNIDGGAGVDVAVFTGNQADYTVTSTGNGLVVSHNNGGVDGTDTLVGVETGRFSDGDVSFGASLQLTGGLNINENVASGASVGQISAVDADGGTWAYSLTDDAGGSVVIDSATGAIATARSLDHETAATQTFTVQASSQSGETLTASYTLDVNDVNEAPGSLSGGFGTVKEFARIGAVVGAVGVQDDPDVGDTHTYSLSDDANGIFTIDSVTGVVKIATHPTGITADTLNLTAVVTDSGGLSATQSFSVAYQDLEASAPQASISRVLVRAGSDSHGSIGRFHAGAGIAEMELLTSPSNGTVTINDNGTFNYRAADGFSGLDSFTAQWIDGNGIASSQTVQVNVVDTAGMSGSLQGSSDADFFLGSQEADNVDGGGGNDALSGGGGDDVLNGGAGDDVFEGGDGDDTLNGGAGIDVADYSDSGNRVVANLATGVATIETISGAGSNEVSSSVGTQETDQLTSIEGLVGSAFNDELTGDAGNNVLSGGAGDDSLVGGAGGDAFRGGDGIDTADFSGADSRVSVDLIWGGGSHGYWGNVYGNNEAVGDSFVGVENAVGSNHADSLTGDNSANRLEGRDGDDVLNGRDGDDVLIGGAGNDLILAGSGNDIIEFSHGDGSDTISNAGMDGSTTDTLRFGGDLTQNDFWLSQEGNDLHIAMINCNDTVTLQDWFGSSSDSRMDRIEAGGQVLVESNVQQLVSAMASWSSANSGQDGGDLFDMPNDTDLSNALTTAWQPAT